MELVCPSCRSFDDGRVTAWPLARDFSCTGCGVPWPVLDRGDLPTPILLPDLGAAEALCQAAAELRGNPAILQAWANQGEDGLRSALASQLATWLPAHWGRHARPPLPSPDLGWLRDWVPHGTDLPDGPVLVLGCGPGGELPLVELPGRELVALEANPVLLQYGRWLAAGAVGVIPYRKLAGLLDFRPIALPVTELNVLERTHWVAGNALDPPFRAGTFALVVAFNLLDSVPDPFVLLQQCEALLQVGGVLVLSSPYHWQAHVTPPSHQLDQHLPPEMDHRAGIEALLTGRVLPGFLDSMELDRSADGIAWDLMVHARYVARYSLHVVRLRKWRDEMAVGT